MKKFIKDHRFLAGLLSIFISVFLVSIVAYGATTIGTNIQTAGTASSTSATTTDYLYVGEDITEPAGIDFTGGDLIVSGAAYFHTKATTTTAFAVGSGTINTLDMAGGDLYVLDDLEVDGLATSTDGFYSMGVLEIGGNGLVRGNITVNGYATSTVSLNTQGTLHVGGNADVDGTLNIGEGTDINKLVFGVCNIATVSVTASSTAFIDCTGATGVAVGDYVFVTATSSLPTNFTIQAASSTVANTINLRILNHGYSEGTDTGVRSFYWQAIK